MPAEGARTAAVAHSFPELIRLGRRPGHGGRGAPRFRPAGVRWTSFHGSAGPRYQRASASSNCFWVTVCLARRSCILPVVVLGVGEGSLRLHDVLPARSFERQTELCIRGGEIRVGLPKLDPVVGVVDDGEGVTGADRIPLADPHLEESPGGLRADGHMGSLDRARRFKSGPITAGAARKEEQTRGEKMGLTHGMPVRVVERWYDGVHRGCGLRRR